MKVEVVVERSVQMSQPWVGRQVFAPLSLILFSCFTIRLCLSSNSSILPSNVFGRKRPKYTSTYTIYVQE